MSLGLAQSRTLSSADADRPWTPTQLLAVACLFGAGTAGVIAGINFTRLGRRDYAVPSAVAGIALFLLHAAAFVFIFPGMSYHVATLVNLAVGLGFMQAQKPCFLDWQARQRDPELKGKKYRPNRVGLLFLASLGCVAVEVGIIFLMLFAKGA